MSDNPSYDELVARVQTLQESNAELKQYCRERQQSIVLLDAIRKAQSLYLTDSEPSEIYQKFSGDAPVFRWRTPLRRRRDQSARRV